MHFLRGVAGPVLLVGLAALSLGSAAVQADPGGLVAAYGFEETAGTSAADSSGSGNTGTLAGPVSSAMGKFGRALTFDGVNDLVNVADSNSLDLTSGVTIEAWVKPEGTGWQTVMLKERPGGLAYALYSSTDTGTPSAEVRTGASTETRGSSSLPFATWSHLATTYDGATLRLYVNGNQVSSRALTGSVEVGTGALRIGGNLVWGEYFRGLIDEVRIYQRALGATEIQADMATAIVSSDMRAPSAPSGLAAAVTQHDVHLTWSASSDDVGVTGYRVSRDGSVIAQLGSAATSYDDTDRPLGSYVYTVIALDAAGHTSLPSNQVTATVGSPEPPTAPGNLTGTVLSGDDVRLNWGLSTGGTGVTSYRVYRDESLIATRGAASPREHDDVNVTVGTHTYKVVAVDSAGTAGPPSTEAFVTIEPDTTAPTVTLGGSSCAGTVAGYVPLRPTVSDDRGPVTLRVELDGATVFGPVTALAAGPYTNLSASMNFFWEIGTTPPGQHVMTAYARDAAGHEVASDPCLWTVAELSISFTSPAAGATLSGAVLVEALALLGDQPAGGNVTQIVFTVDGVGGSDRVDRSAPYQFSWDTTALPNGTHTLKAELWWMDYGTPRATSTIQVTVNNTVPPPPTGLVAAFGFDEASGQFVTDSSGPGNTGTISGATRSASGKYGGALSFDGLNDLVSIADSNSLDLTTGMTLEAWVRPTAINDWRTVLFKERTGGLVYGLYSATDTGRPGGFLDIGGERSARAATALPLNTWTHLAATYDGGFLRLYLNGTQAATLALTGGIPVTTGQLKIGGNSVWAEWFKGLIDEVRVYNRALTAAEIAADRDRPVASGS